MNQEDAFGLIELMLASLLFLTLLLPLAFSLNQQLKIFSDQKRKLQNEQSKEIQNCSVETLTQRIVISCDDDEIFFF